MQRIITLGERKAAEAVQRQAGVEALMAVLADYARTHRGRFLLFGSAARKQMRYDSDVDILLDFPSDTFSAAWDFAEAACWDRGLEPDLLPLDGCKQAFLGHIGCGPPGMSDARWFEIDAAISAAIRHFSGATTIFGRLLGTLNSDDKYVLEMGFLHAMQAAQTSLEAALLRILDLLGEEAPTGPRWHTDLLSRAANPIGNRIAILGDEAARAANETRQFRGIAAHAYDSFDPARATDAAGSAAVLVTLLPPEIARFRQAIDP